MFTSDPLSAVLAAVATGAMLGLLPALYREHREPFLFWAVVAWAGTLAGFLAQVPRELAWQREVWAFTAALAIAVKSLAFLAAGLTYRAPALVSRRRAVIGLGVAVVLAGVQTAWLPVLPPTAGALRELPITLTHAVAILIAGCAFWPGGARRDWAARSAARAVAGFADRDPLRVLLPHGRGARLLALALLAWGALQFGFLLPIPATAERALFRIAALLQGLQSVALVMLVLDIARQRAEFVRGFNQTLLDAMDTGLVLVGPDRRIARANRWMTERFGDALGGRMCHETYLDRQEPCEACPWRDGQPATRELGVDARDGRKLLIHASPLTAPDSSALLLELVSDVTRQEALRMRVLHSERLAAIGEMAARVAHEVRSPLGAIGVHTELAREELMPEGDVTEARAHLDVVTSRITTVASLIESYLEFGRPPKLSPARVDLDDVIDTCGKRADGFSAPALALMRRYRWPGNVRELEHAVHRAVILAAGPEITPVDLDLPADVAGARPGSPTGEAATLDELERQQILAALERSGGNRTAAAAALGIDRTTLHRKLDKYKAQ